MWYSWVMSFQRMVFSLTRETQRKFEIGQFHSLPPRSEHLWEGVRIIDGLLRTFQNMQLRLTSWSTDCDNSLKYLKGVLSSAPIVILPDFKVPFKVYTDASKWVVGAVLVQEKEGLEYVVVYTSRALNATQKHWSTSDRELWAIVWAEREFRHYLGLSLFTIITDHCPFLVLVHCKCSLRMISRAEGLDGSWSWTQ